MDIFHPPGSFPSYPHGTFTDASWERFSGPPTPEEAERQRRARERMLAHHAECERTGEIPF